MDLGGIFSRAGVAAASAGEQQGERINRAAALEQLLRYRRESEELQNQINRQNIEREGLAGLTIPRLNRYDLSVNPSATVAAPAPAPIFPPPPPPPAPPPPPTRAAPSPAPAPAPTAAPTNATRATSPPATAQPDTPDRISSQEARRRRIDLSSVQDGQLVSYGGAVYRVRNNSPFIGFGFEDFGLVRVTPQEEREYNYRQSLRRTTPPATAGVATTAAAPAAVATTAAAPAAAPELPPPPPPPSAGVQTIGTSADPARIPLGAQSAAVSLENLQRRDNLGLDARRIEQQYALLEELVSVYSQSGNSEGLLSTIQLMLGLQQQYDMAIGLSGLADLRRGDSGLIKSFLTNMYGFSVDINPLVDNQGRWVGSYQVVESGVPTSENISADELISFIRTQFDDVFEQRLREAEAAYTQAQTELESQLAQIDARGSVEARLARQRNEIDLEIARIENSGSIELQTFTTEMGDTFVYQNGNLFRLVPDETPSVGGYSGQPTVKLEPVTIPRS